jgi:hypothetical protein
MSININSIHAMNYLSNSYPQQQKNDSDRNLRSEYANILSLCCDIFLGHGKINEVFGFVLSRTRAKPWASRGLRCLTRRADAELKMVLYFGINMPHAPSPLVKFGWSDVGWGIMHSNRSETGGFCVYPSKTKSKSYKKKRPH